MVEPRHIVFVSYLCRYVWGSLVDT